MLSKLLFLVAYYPILGLPLILWLSVAVFLILGFVLWVALANRRGVYVVPLKFHFMLGIVGVALLLIQTILLFAIFTF